MTENDLPQKGSSFCGRKSSQLKLEKATLLFDDLLFQFMQTYRKIPPFKETNFDSTGFLRI